MAEGMKVKRILLFLCQFLFVNLFSQERSYSWDFSDCEIKDVLYAVSIDTGISIVADDTVDGKCDLRFAGGDFETAFESFLKSARLYVEKKENVWTVSRCSLRGETTGRVSFDACDMSPAVMLEKLSLAVDRAITYDSLPAGKMSVHFKNLTVDELFECLARRFGSYDVVRNSSGLHFAKKVEMRAVEAVNSFANVTLNEDDSVSVDLQDALFSEVVNQLFEKACSDGELGFCLMAGSDVRIQRSVFTASSFEDALFKICAQNGFCSVFSNGIYNILLDAKSKDSVVFGEKQWQKFFLKYTSTETIIPVLYSQVGKVECSYIPGEKNFFALVNETEKIKIEKLINDVDVKVCTHIVDLKYLKPGELLKQLPPSVNKDCVFVSDDNSCVYFKGTDDEYNLFCEELNAIDKSAKRISYDLLILQYDEAKQNSWNGNITADGLSLGDRNSISAGLGSVLNLNLNVISTFGINFAASLQSSIENNSTKVFADTTIHGISGKPISFQNTNTFRYRDNNLDPETGKPVYSGVTKEIVSGITLDILGWASGEGMVTSTVTARVSRQGTDTSSSTGNPPPTTEKTITTEVCCKSGEPVILSGLIQNSQTVEKKQNPLLGYIPILGAIFRAHEKTEEKSQMVIYLVPHVEGECEKEEIMSYSADWAKGKMNGLLEGEKGDVRKNEEL